MSSILETFLILFETNSAQVTKEQASIQSEAGHTAEALGVAGKAGETAGEKIAHSGRLGAFEIKELHAEVKRFGVDFIRQTAEMASGLLGFLAVEKLVDTFFEETEMTEQLGKTAKQLGVNVSVLDAWDQGVKRAGGSSSDFETSLDNLNKKMAGLAAGAKTGGVSKFFKELGLSAADAKKPVTDLLPLLADAFSKMSQDKATGIGERLGLDATTIGILHEGRAAVDEMIAHQKALGVVTDENVEAAERFEKSWHDFTALLRGESFGALDAILPLLSDVLGGVTEFAEYLNSHKNLVEGFFIGVGGIVATIYGPAMAAAAAETLLAVAPIAAVVIGLAALAAAFALAYDDVKNFEEGNNSLIGTLIGKYPAVGKVIQASIGVVGTAFRLAKAGASDFEAGLKSLLILFRPLTEAFENLFNKLGVAAVAAMGDAVNILVGYFANLEKYAGKVVTWLEKIHLPGGATIASDAHSVEQAGVRGVKNAIAGGASMVNAFAAAIPVPGNAAIQAHAVAGQGQLATLGHAAAQFPTVASTGAGAPAGDTHITVANQNITVNTQSTDPKTIVKTIKDEMSNQYKQVIAHHATGVVG